MLLQGSDRLYLSTPEELPNKNSSQRHRPPGHNGYAHHNGEDSDPEFEDSDTDAADRRSDVTDHDHHAIASSNKQWLVVPIPYSYTAANYPVRVCT